MEWSLSNSCDVGCGRRSDHRTRRSARRRIKDAYHHKPFIDATVEVTTPRQGDRRRVFFKANRRRVTQSANRELRTSDPWLIVRPWLHGRRCRVQGGDGDVGLGVDISVARFTGKRMRFRQKKSPGPSVACLRIDFRDLQSQPPCLLESDKNDAPVTLPK